MEAQLKTKIAKFKISQVGDEIVESLMGKQVTIISTPTGSGKSMVVPYICNTLSNRKVYCTVPRIVIAKQNASGSNLLLFDNPNMGFGNGAGYMSGNGGDSQNAKIASVIYITEGSFMSREIKDSLKPGSYVIIDEVHEQGVNMMAMMAMSFDLLAKGIKVVLMSATCDTKDYAEYYSGYSVGVVEMSSVGTQFPIEKKIVESPIIEIANDYINGGRCLVFVAGKEDIEYTIRYLRMLVKDKANEAHIYPFHSELEEEESDKPLKRKGSMIVVCTNILQSGVTLNDITSVYTTGIGKRIQNMNGIASLREYQLSKSEIIQSWGRGGRTCPSVAYMTQEEADCFDSRENMPTPELLRMPLENAVLAFSMVGLDMAAAKIFKSPPYSEVIRAKSVVAELGLIENGWITALGRKIAKENAEYRIALTAHWLEEQGFYVLGQKLMAVMSFGHPFRKSDGSAFHAVKNEGRRSSFLAWIMQIEAIMEKFPAIDAMNELQFKAYCMERGIFMKSLKKIMKAFRKLDGGSEDEDTTEKSRYDAMAKAVSKAFGDVAEYPNYVVSDGFPLISMSGMEVPEGHRVLSFGPCTVVGRRKYQMMNYAVVPY